jgi:hypothetical protein
MVAEPNFQPPSHLAAELDPPCAARRAGIRAIRVSRRWVLEARKEHVASSDTKSTDVTFCLVLSRSGEGVKTQFVCAGLWDLIHQFAAEKEHCFCFLIRRDTQRYAGTVHWLRQVQK